ncbi:hypothetical protein [Xanthomonas cannabis]|uniref:hypothetical protein n=1 Tax=Xanthomonas cannabis TaxID=1885674 RepID=UPI00141A87CF|nr:hypothetical protein [Xanthomonas cannabis]NIK62581.1 hypothetical protein [Xanthomonas cannabis]
MARQNIDTTTNNGGSIGDPAPVAFGKVNSNFVELYGTVVFKGKFGSYGASLPYISDASNYAAFDWLMSTNPSTTNLPESLFGILKIESTDGVSLVPFNGRTIIQTFFPVNSSNIWRRQSVNGAAWSVWARNWNTANTTVDSNNFIKRAG